MSSSLYLILTNRRVSGGINFMFHYNALAGNLHVGIEHVTIVKPAFSKARTIRSAATMAHI